MTGVAVALAVAAGLAGAVQAAVMGELGERVGVFPALAFSGVVAVVIGLALLLVARQSFRGLADVARQPVWLWSGGALSVLIILAITVASPRIGLAATIAIIIAFNLGVAALSDRFGWFGFEQISITWTRALGLVLLGAGAALSLYKSG
ncbi:MAG: bacterial/archaeal transporter family-2 protein [Gaiellaceae bacterium]|nr:bacterial/archaeal transporter family-2 protein [Gaiellaceae bacterium]